MTIALWCLLAAGLLHLPLALGAKYSRRYDNAQPREYLAHLTGWRARAHWAQLNSLEVFPLFAAAVLTAHLISGANGHADLLAVAFIVLRLLYSLCYLANKATLRSLAWSLAQACSIGLFIVAAIA